MTSAVGLVLEAFVRHDMAPVASRVADRQQDRLAGALGFGQRLRPPRPPVDWIILVLEQVGAGFQVQAIFRHGASLHGAFRLSFVERPEGARLSAGMTISHSIQVAGGGFSSYAKAMADGSTIFALSSGAGKAGIAVIRVSGPGVRVVMSAMSAPEVLDRRAGLRRIVHPKTRDVARPGGGPVLRRSAQ